ncbi:MAG: BrnT family toxin [Bdellovibrionaceae bacterium]|nr:BrnT family toxin [Leptospiraceae bacterium]MCK6599021.1 BrnT family toxin [Pseudobdellovibrionaceae bacterium]NUM41971.1 BrnT family toxin [Leptospiraceae bacterium]
MYEIQFEWDEKKNQANIRKHRVSFEEAKTIFYDENARIIDDPDHSVKEERFIILGRSYKFQLLTVCHCYKLSDETIRIISARKATKQEIKEYEELL